MDDVIWKKKPSDRIWAIMLVFFYNYFEFKNKSENNPIRYVGERKLCFLEL